MDALYNADYLYNMDDSYYMDNNYGSNDLQTMQNEMINPIIIQLQINLPYVIFVDGYLLNAFETSIEITEPLVIYQHLVPSIPVNWNVNAMAMPDAGIDPYYGYINLYNPEQFQEQ